VGEDDAKHLDDVGVGVDVVVQQHDVERRQLLGRGSLGLRRLLRLGDRDGRLIVGLLCHGTYFRLREPAAPLRYAAA
jgi:hypothetical protein